MPSRPSLVGNGPAFVRALDPAGWRPALAIVAVLAAVVVGGPLLDGLVTEPSIGTVRVAPGLTIEAAPGWFIPAADTGATNGTAWTVLQKGDVSLAIAAEPAQGAAATALLEAIESAWRDDPGIEQIAFRAIEERRAGRFPGAAEGYEAWLAGWGVPVDGELVVAVTGWDRAVVFDCYAPQGDLGTALGDFERMLATLRVDG